MRLRNVTPRIVSGEKSFGWVIAALSRGQMFFKKGIIR
jgi:hypothetical protein